MKELLQWGQKMTGSCVWQGRHRISVSGFTPRQLHALHLISPICFSLATFCAKEFNLNWKASEASAIRVNQQSLSPWCQTPSEKYAPNKLRIINDHNRWAPFPPQRLLWNWKPQWQRTTNNPHSVTQHFRPLWKATGDKPSIDVTRTHRPYTGKLTDIA